MTTTNLGLPEWAANQNQPDVTHNTALRVLDCLTQMRAQSMTETAPPGSPLDGDVYLMASGSSGAWAGRAPGDVAMYIGTAWVFRTPKGGWECWVIDDEQRVRFDDGSSPGAWIPV